ncbi:MAG: rhomboid family intramembrane serine protease [Bryobacteraceae bacterium]|nr:rhomboid family intramembrane serine protease [Bryobacteraceae bacterium]
MTDYKNRYPRVGFASAGGFPVGVKWLLISNIALFVIYFFAVRADAGFLFAPFGLTPRSVLQVFGVYQLFTYMFLHSPFGFSHVLFNMLALWMFGTDLERTWGSRRFLQYYFLCGVGAGICVVIGNAMYGTLDTRTIGASGAIYGVLLAFGLLFPDRIVLFSFLFPIKAKYFVMIIGAIAFLSSLGASGSGVSHVAHLGGMLFGYLYLRTRMPRTDIIGSMRRQYEDWKIERARRKFQVYLRKRESDHDPWVH